MEPITPLPIAHILVPLDGSRLAESALSPTIALAERLGARVTLLHILERGAPETIHGERHLTSTGEAEAYLTGAASRFADAGITVAVHTHPSPEGDVAGSIAIHALASRADLIVMCAHGRGGLRGWLFGAIAQRVVRHGGAPVLLIRQETSGPTGPLAPRTVVVALDGTPEGEAALPASLTLARALGTSLHLLVVVATLATVGGDRVAAAQLTPIATSAALDLESDTARAYLAQLRERLGDSGVPTTLEVERGEASRVVLDRAARAGGSLVALATHGRSGFDALWSASVGAKVVARASGPLLLVSAKRAVAPTPGD
jgi:nucleotide-binding universal stress UspA family protein